MTNAMAQQRSGVGVGGGNPAGSSTEVQYRQDASHFGADSTFTFNPTTHLVIAGINDRGGQVYNVKAYGAVGDGMTDDTSAINAAVTATADGGTLFFPPGIYQVSSTIDLSSKNAITVLGTSVQAQNVEGSTIRGTVAGDLLKYVPARSGSGTIHISGMTLYNTSSSAAAKAFHSERTIGSSIENSGIASEGGYGLFMPADTFSFAIRSVWMKGDVTSNPNSIGIYAAGDSIDISTCDIVDWHEGIRVASSWVNILGGRFEVNQTAIVLGKTDTGSAVAVHGNVGGFSMEANDTGILVNDASALTLHDFTIQGSTNAPSGQSLYGLRSVGQFQGTVRNILVVGSFSQAAISAEYINTSVSWEGVLTGNSFAPHHRTWNVLSGLYSTSSGFNQSFRQSDFTLRSDDTVSGLPIQRHGVVSYLSAIDQLNPAVEGHNLRGKAVAVTAGTSTLGVVFTGEHSAGNNAISSASPTTGGSLSAGTYYYAGSIVTQRGEAHACCEVTATVSGGNNAVNISFYGVTQDGFKRRVYRGTASGVYDGYYELPLNSSATFTDTGAAFDGRRSNLDGGVDETDMTEPDANYAILVTPNWNTTVWITNKATTGFTVNFGTTAPANATVDWFMVR